ncbi:MAG TPA: hypothetical protein VGF13_05445 [Verrucomicrobiae bacterium]|jgi:hypothetical protein
MTDQEKRDAAGLEDVMRSVRVLARQARELVGEAGGVAEREIAMVLTVTEDVRDRVLSEEALKRGREQALLKNLRRDAHRAVDIAFDTAAVVFVFGADIVDKVLDRPRVSVGNSIPTPVTT